MVIPKPGSIEASHVAKAYRVSQKKGWRKTADLKPVLRDVSLDVRAGQIFGLVGRNGAGKTTLIKILTGILLADSGSVTVNGFKADTERLKIKGSSTLVKSGVWTGLMYQMSVLDNLKFYARLSGMPEALISARAAEMIDTMGLSEKAHELPWYLSAGQRQKVCLAMMGMVVTPVVFLDEPTTHLDPVSASDVRYFVKEVMNKKRGQTVFMSTHYLDEAELLCDQIAILESGRIVACGTMGELRERAACREYLHIGLVAPDAERISVLRQCDGIKSVEIEIDDAIAQRYSVRLLPKSDASSIIPRVLEVLQTIDAQILWVKTQDATLQDVYLQMVGSAIA